MEEGEDGKARRRRGGELGREGRERLPVSWTAWSTDLKVSWEHEMGDSV